MRIEHLKNPYSLIWLAFVFTIFAISSQAHSHHSVSGRYNEANVMTLTGTIKDVDWRNPHVAFFVDVTEEDGSITSWEMSTVTVAILRDAGISKSVLMGDGSPVTIVGIPALDTRLNHMWVYRVTYSDEHFYQLARAPRR